GRWPPRDAAIGLGVAECQAARAGGAEQPFVAHLDVAAFGVAGAELRAGFGQGQGRKQGGRENDYGRAREPTHEASPPCCTDAEHTATSALPPCTMSGEGALESRRSGLAPSAAHTMSSACSSACGGPRRLISSSGSPSAVVSQNTSVSSPGPRFAVT